MTTSISYLAGAVALLIDPVARQGASAVDPVSGIAPLLELPLAEAAVGALAMAGLFILFGLRAPAERSGGCGSCSGDCGSCPMDHEETP